jgi:aspartate/methionine/tyrosine aminotransferase
LPQKLGEEDMAERLLREAGVIVHPGAFYGIAGVGRVVVSLLGLMREFGEGIQKIKTVTGENHGSY